MTTILLVDNSFDGARLMQKYLQEAMREPFTLHHTMQVGEAKLFLGRHHLIDVIVADISLPDADTIETVHLLREIAANKIPILFIIASNNASSASETLQRDGQDYLVKAEYSGDLLTRVIRYAIERKKYQDQAIAAKAKVKALRQEAKLLRQKQQQLVVANKAKDDFISLASHQLRTPATGVKQYIGMVLEGFAGDVPAHLEPFLAKAYESNERQLAIVNDLLQVAQLDAGNVRLRYHATNLTDMLLNIVSEQSSKFSQRKQKLLYNPLGPDVVLSIDAERMHMVFDNLIDNASKYTPENRRVTVSLRQSLDEVSVHVKDEGVGIAPENISKVFKKFSRVANSRSDLVGGSGLGLYWAKQIVDLHNGSIDVQSDLGIGSEFIVRLQPHHDDLENVELLK